MPHLRGLTEEEQRAFIHKLQNGATKNCVPGDENLEGLYTDIVNRTLEKELAKVSEEENYNLKNRYRLNKKQLQYADPKRMPVDESKVLDLLKN